METKLAVRKEAFDIIRDDFLSQSGLSKEIFQKEVSFAIQHIAGNEYLQKCLQASLLKAVLNVAQTGLTLNPVRKYAFIVPRYVRGEWQAVLEPSYVGLCKLLTDTGVVKSVSAQVINEGDDIDINLADNKIKHVPYIITGRPKGNIKGAYSKAMLSDGSPHIEVMGINEIDEIMERSQSYIAFKAQKSKSCIWVSDKSEMCRKTVIKRHYKYLPKSEGAERIEKAIDLDHEMNGYEEELCSISKFMVIQSLMNNSTLDENQLQELEMELEGDKVTDRRANEIIGKLNECQKTSLKEDMARQLDNPNS